MFKVSINSCSDETFRLVNPARLLGLKLPLTVVSI
jgi:hypothetical protein